MSAGDARGHDAMASDAQAMLERHAIAALVESMHLPAIVFSGNGSIALCNHAALPLVTPGADGVPRAHVHDGTDLWTIISARAQDASLYDVRSKMRVADGQVTEVTFLVMPFRDAAGSLVSAMVFALDTLGTRVRGLGEVADGRRPRGITDVLRRLGELTEADDVYVIESEPGFAAAAHVLASWARAGDGVPTGQFDIRGTPSDSFAGRRFVCIPDGLVDAYPAEAYFVDGGYRAYAGVAIHDALGERIGILAALWRDPLADIPGISAVMTIMAADAARLLVEAISQRDLRESEQRYSAVFEGSEVPILLIDPETTQVVDANPAACEFYGYPREELMAMSVLQTDALSAEAVRDELERAASGARVHFVSKHLLAGGRLRDVDVNIGPIMVGGRPLLYSMVHDITERKRMESELERSKRNLEIIVGQRTEDLLRANAELQQASTARDMVFASLAREMRTSLQTITGFSDLLLQGAVGELSAEQQRQVQMIRDAGRELAGFATTLLETRRTEDTGALALDLESFDLVNVVESVLFGLSSFADEKELRLELVADERPINVETDRYKTQQILLNLLSNAIRYTQRGSVTVTVARIGDTHCSVSVADTGPGLPQERIETLFQGPEVHAPAAGIGLPASLRIASTLRGTIDVQSVRGKGSVFMLMLPLIYADEAAAAPPGESLSSSEMAAEPHVDRQIPQP